MGRTIRTGRATRGLGILTLATLTLASAGCDGWEWSFETNGIGLTESITKKLASYISGNTLVNPGGGIGVGISTGGPAVGAAGSGGGAGSAGGGSGGGGGGSGNPAIVPYDPSLGAADDPEEPVINRNARLGDTGILTVAGRVWGVVNAASHVDGEHVVLEGVLEARGDGVKGVFGAFRISVPRADWPNVTPESADEATWPARAADAPVLPKDAPTLPLTWDKDRTGLELAGARYNGDFHAARLALIPASESAPTITGTIDLLAHREDATSATQWVRLRALSNARAVAAAR